MPITGSCVGVTAPLPVKACCRNFHLNKQAHKFVRLYLHQALGVSDVFVHTLSLSVCLTKQAPWNFIWMNFAPFLGSKQYQDWDKKANKPWPYGCSICKRCDIPPFLLSVVCRKFCLSKLLEFVSFFILLLELKYDKYQTAYMRRGKSAT